MKRRAHWERVYGEKAVDQVSWFQTRAGVSREMIEGALADRDAVIVDVGGGASPLAVELTADGYRWLVVMDLAAGPLRRAPRVSGIAGSRILRVVGDALQAPLAAGVVGLWHDRAVFHFLTEGGERERYVAEVRRAVAPGRFVLVATFAEDGPERCSGLSVARYSPNGLRETFGGGFELLDSRREVHRTPSGGGQPFTYCLFRRRQDPSAVNPAPGG